MTPRRFLVLAPLFALGCGSDNKPLTTNDFINQYAQDVCAAVSPACLVPVPSCAAIQVAGQTQNAQDATGQGRHFMPDAAEGCLGKVNSVYGKLSQGAVALKPMDFQGVSQTCSLVYRGPSRANESCTADADCIGGLICDKGLCGTRSVVSPGAGCANIGETCPEGAYCGTSSSGARLCEPKIGPGGTCDPSTPCIETLRCANGVCGAQVGIGEDCAVDQDCTSGFCEPYAGKCAKDIRFANGSAACVAMGGT